MKHSKKHRLKTKKDDAEARKKKKRAKKSAKRSLIEDNISSEIGGADGGEASKRKKIVKEHAMGPFIEENTSSEIGRADVAEARKYKIIGEEFAKGLLMEENTSPEICGNSIGLPLYTAASQLQPFYVTQPVAVEHKLSDKLDEFNKYLQEQLIDAKDEKLSLTSYLPKRRSHEMEHRTLNSTLSSVVDHPPVTHKKLQSLTRKQLGSFRLCAGMIPSEYFANTTPSEVEIVEIEQPEIPAPCVEEQIEEVTKQSKRSYKLKVPGSKRGRRGRGRGGKAEN